MKNLLIVATSALCVLLAVAVPLPEQDVQIVQIPLEGDKELDILSLPENEGQLTDRNKRTIGVLRQLFPELSKKVEQVIEEKIQLILPIIFRNVGPLLLRGGLGGLSGGGGATNTNDDGDDFDDDDGDTSVSNSEGGTTSSRTGSGGRKVSISLPTFPPDTDDEEEDDTQSTINTDNKDEDNDVQSKDEGSTTAKSTDTTQVSITEKPIVTTNPIQTSTKPTVTTIITETTTTMIELETTTQPSQFSSTAPTLIRISIDTTESSISNSYNYDKPTTIPSSSNVMSSTSQDDETTENVFGTNDTADSIDETTMQNTNEYDSVDTTTNTIDRMLNENRILTFQDSSTESDYSDETTQGLSDIDFARLIDIRSLNKDESKPDSTNYETTNSILPENNASTTVDSIADITSTGQSILEKKYLPISENFVRRRKSAVLERQHIY
ncbi:mucin-5AC isoform X1 [Contarinia nasturtii]|uniref:mucin-5AC isoform X1 n=1 Tax=Contarinia nasturtii TaxID=265458 RepID=UPI0012D46EB5|nr:mucin-5AC isoform X1 [Contarinia nasturtii]